MKNPMYDANLDLPDYYFEMQAGSGNVLDNMRCGRVAVKCTQRASRLKIQYKEVSTFLLKKLSIFLKDDKLLFLPKENDEIIRSI
jgi:hypothetical protein